MGDYTATDTYKSISKPSVGSYRELGSRFLSFACPVSDEEEIKAILAGIKKEYFDARHHCYAYRLGIDGETWRANDDGEPSSSAGKPILGQLLSREISDVLVVVVRYFGGTKLGIPGLIRAYRSAASDALDQSEITEKILMVSISVTFDYIKTDQIMKLIKEHAAVIEQQSYDNTCRLQIRLRKNNLDRFLREAGELGAEMKLQ
jgi:uncharacterized YigZ family protein